MSVKRRPLRGAGGLLQLERNTLVVARTVVAQTVVVQRIDTWYREVGTHNSHDIRTLSAM